MPPSPRVLLSIDYEPWFALTRRYDLLSDPLQRQTLDDGFTKRAIDSILDMLGPAKASIYIVGEIDDATLLEEVKEDEIKEIVLKSNVGNLFREKYKAHNPKVVEY